jgi:hypothetical protein
MKRSKSRHYAQIRTAATEVVIARAIVDPAVIRIDVRTAAVAAVVNAERRNNELDNITVVTGLPKTTDVKNHVSGEKHNITTTVITKQIL